MQSRLLEAFDPATPANRELKPDLALLLDLNEGARAELLRMLPDLLTLRTRSEIERQLAPLVLKYDIELRTLWRGLRPLKYFARQLLEQKVRDKPDEIVGDLLSLEIVPTRQRAVAVDALRWLDESLPSLKPDYKKSEFASGLLPSLRSFGTTVELRAVQEDPYRPGEPIEAYTPNITTCVGIISVKIGLDTGAFKDVFFQTDKDGLILLIREFEAAVKDLDALEAKMAIALNTAESIPVLVVDAGERR